MAMDNDNFTQEIYLQNHDHHHHHHHHHHQKLRLSKAKSFGKKTCQDSSIEMHRNAYHVQGTVCRGGPRGWEVFFSDFFLLRIIEDHHLSFVIHLHSPLRDSVNVLSDR